MKKKLGIFIPTRKSFTISDVNNPAILLEDVGKELEKQLRKYFAIYKVNLFNSGIINNKMYNSYLESFHSDRIEDNIHFNEINGYFWYSQIDRSSDSHDMMILENMSRFIPVMNNYNAIKLGIDKLKTSIFLNQHTPLYLENECITRSIVPPFAFLSSKNEIQIKQTLKFFGTVLLKPRFGGFGIGIVKIEDVNQLLDILDFSNLDSFYIEKFIENDINEWVSINIVGGKYLYAFRKQSSKIKDYKIIDRNKEGGRTIKINPSSRHIDLALYVAHQMKLDFCGIDIIKEKKTGNLYVVDVNTFPGIYTECMPADEIAHHFVEMIKNKVK